MLAHCAPWPVKMPRTRAAEREWEAKSDSWAAWSNLFVKSSAVKAAMDILVESVDFRVFSVQDKSRRFTSGFCLRNAAWAARVAWRDFSEAAEKLNGDIGVAVGYKPCRSGVAGINCSRMAWALVPPNPKLLTLALRGPSGTAGQSRASWRICKWLLNGLTVGLSSLSRRLGGITPCCNAREAFSTPATPAVPSECPSTVLIDPTYKGCVPRDAWVSGPNSTLLMASASIGSPAAVPVPGFLSISANW
jgi:hypothetical protein